MRFFVFSCFQLSLCLINVISQINVSGKMTLQNDYMRIWLCAFLCSSILHVQNPRGMLKNAVKYHIYFMLNFSVLMGFVHLFCHTPLFITGETQLGLSPVIKEIQFRNFQNIELQLIIPNQSYMCMCWALGETAKLRENQCEDTETILNKQHKTKSIVNEAIRICILPIQIQSIGLFTS